MRREQVLKICLNFFLTDETEFKPKGDNSWTFGASDFSEGEIEVISFALRFKNAEIASDFKKAIDDALACRSKPLDEKKSGLLDEKSELIRRLQLPNNFFDYLNAKDCPGCIGCKSEDYVFDTNRTSDVKSDPHPLPVNQPKLEINTTIKLQGQNVEKHVSFNFHDEHNSNFGSGIKKSDGSANIFAKYNEDNPPTTPSTSIFGAMNSFTTQKQPGDSIFSSSLNTTPTSTEAKITFGMNSTETGIFGVKSSITFSNNTATNGNIFGTPSKNENPISFGFSSNNQTADVSSTTKIFGSNAATFSFADAAKELDKSREESLKSEKSPNSSIFASASKSFNFADASKDLDKTKDSSFNDQSSSETLGSTVKSFSFEDASKELEKSTENTSTSNDKVPDFIANSNDFGGFAALASAKETPTWTTMAASKDTPPGGFFGLTVTKDVFSGKGADNSAQNEDGSANDDNFDPHYEPIIALPDEIQVSTGEEEEIKVFGDRAKLFRYDTKLKEWKERGDN